MFPNVSAVFNNWTSAIQMKIVKTTAVDFEAQTDVLDVPVFEAVIQPMPPREVQRKPEGERQWRWLTVWSTTPLQIDSVIQDPDGIQYRIQNTQNWSQGGFYTSDVVQQPDGL